MKLTGEQVRALDRIEKGIVRKSEFGYEPFEITGPVEPQVVKRVCSMGLARWKTDGNGFIAVLTVRGQMQFEKYHSQN